MMSSQRPVHAGSARTAGRPDAQWMTAFAERLLELRPTSTPLDAVRAAMQNYELGVAIAPTNAAEAYANEVGVGDICIE